MADRPTPQPGILRIAPYVPGRSKAEGHAEPIKLSANESPLGASPKAIAALEGLGDRLASYPDGGSIELRKTLAEVHGLEADRITVGAGSDELLHLLAQTYLGAGDEAVVTEYGFLVYPIVAMGAGATPVAARDTDFTASVDSILAAVTDRTRMVFIANPNNPTGTCISGDELRRLHEGLRPDILLVVDSAYAEYVTDPDYEAGTALVRAAENVVMVRTFSKMGLAAIRLGWMYAPDHITDAVNRLRGPFNVNMAAQVAGAAAARDLEFTAELKVHNAKWRDWLTAELDGNAMRVLPSQGNFILVLFESEAAAETADRTLLAEGLVVRQTASYKLPNALRISIGTPDAMRAVARVLKGWADNG